MSFILCFDRETTLIERLEDEYPFIYYYSTKYVIFNKYTGYAKFNPEKYKKEYNKAFYQNNKEQEKQRSKDYIEENKDKPKFKEMKKKSNAKYRANNQEEINKKQNMKVPCPHCNKPYNTTSIKRHIKNSCKSNPESKINNKKPPKSLWITTLKNGKFEVRAKTPIVDGKKSKTFNKKEDAEEYIKNRG